MAEADKVATHTVRVQVVIKEDGTLNECPYCHRELKIKVIESYEELMIYCDNTIQSGSGQGQECGGVWIVPKELDALVRNHLPK